MVVQITLPKTLSVERLIGAWAKIYTPDFQALPIEQQPALYLELLETNSLQGRASTLTKLNKHLIALHSEVASIQTSSLYAYMENVMSLRELRRLAEASLQIYKLLVTLYHQDALGIAELTQQHHHNLTDASFATAAGNGDNIEVFAQALEPALLEFQQLHQQSQDWRSLGFLTTQFNFCNRRLMQKLTPCEQLLIRPYLQFVEEQVAAPWQRVCAAAAPHSVNSPRLEAVEKMMPRSTQVAIAAYNTILKQCSRHQSRRGLLNHPDVMHSCVRDLKMFQAYFWLCVLEGNLFAIEKELLDLCVRVMPSVGVKWDLIAIWTRTLMEELLRPLEPAVRQEVLPYATQMQQIFLNAKAQFDTPLARSITQCR